MINKDLFPRSLSQVIFHFFSPVQGAVIQAKDEIGRHDGLPGLFFIISEDHDPVCAGHPFEETRIIVGHHGDRLPAKFTKYGCHGQHRPDRIAIGIVVTGDNNGTAPADQLNDVLKFEIDQNKPVRAGKVNEISWLIEKPVKYFNFAAANQTKEIMNGNITLTMIKPDAVRKGHIGHIIAHITEGGFNIVAMKYLKMTRVQAQKFYEVHRERPFYNDLVEFMSSGPIVAALLTKDNAINAFRDFIGKTNPDEAAPGTIRALYGSSIQENAVHGSDSDENAIREAAFFFSELERF